MKMATYLMGKNITFSIKTAKWLKFSTTTCPKSNNFSNPTSKFNKTKVLNIKEKQSPLHEFPILIIHTEQQFFRIFA